MKLGRKPGIVRRPIEYILVGLFLVLTAFLVWANMVIKNDTNKQSSPGVDLLQDTHQLDINYIAEKNLSDESSLDKSYDAWELNSNDPVDSAGDSVSEAYDETTY